MDAVNKLCMEAINTTLMYLFPKMKEHAIFYLNTVYKVIEVLKKRIIELKARLTVSKNETVKLAIVHLCMGILLSLIRKTEEAKDQFIICIDLLKNRKLESGVILPIMSALNFLDKLYLEWNLFAEAKIHLEKAKELYTVITENIISLF